MATALGHRDLRAVLDTAGALAALHGGAGHAEALPPLAALIGADLATYHRLHLRTRDEDVLAYPRNALPPAGVWPAYREEMSRHPLIRHYAATGDPTPRKISDFLSAREFRRLPLYHEYYRLMPAQDQLSLPLQAAPGMVTAFSLGRSRGQFGERERALLALLTPHLAGLHRQQERRRLLDRAQRLLAGASTATAGIAVLDANERVLATNGGLWPRLQDSLGDVTEGEPLPVPLRAKLRTLDPLLPGQREAGVLDPPLSAELTVLAGRVCRVRRVRLDEGELAVLVEEQAGSEEAGDERFSSLSGREQQVLRLAARGHTDAVIGRELDLSRRTVNKHLQKTYAKLGVPNRAAAVAVLGEGTVRALTARGRARRPGLAPLPDATADGRASC